MPENEKDSPESGAGCGGTSDAPLAYYDPRSSSWRTCAGSLFEDSLPFLEACPASGMTRSGRLYARRTWVRRTAARGSSSWLTPNGTPNATSNNGSNAGRPSTGKSLMRQATGEWPTPRAEDSECSGARISRGTVDTLTAKARQDWPTPNCGDADRGSDATAKREGAPSLTGAVSLWPTPDTINRKSARALTASTENGRRSGGGQSSPPGLEQAVELTAGIIPRELEGIENLPPATRALWPTPQTTDANSAARHTTTTGVMHPGTTLTDAMRAEAGASTWLTPQSRDHKGISQKVAKGQLTGSLCDQLSGLRDSGPPDPANPSTRGSRPVVLNPRWVACLMGFQADWLDGISTPPSPRHRQTPRGGERPSKPSATPSRRRKPSTLPDTSGS